MKISSIQDKVARMLTGSIGLSPPLRGPKVAVVGDFVTADVCDSGAPSGDTTTAGAAGASASSGRGSGSRSTTTTSTDRESGATNGFDPGRSSVRVLPNHDTAVLSRILVTWTANDVISNGTTYPSSVLCLGNTSGEGSRIDIA